MRRQFYSLRILIWAIIIVSALATQYVVTAPLGAYAQGPVYDAEVASPTLNIRTAPASSASIVATVYQGTLIPVLTGRSADSQWVYGTTDGGVTGWMYKAYLALRKTLVVDNLPVMGSNAPTGGGTSSGGTSGGGSQPAPAGATPTPNAPPPPAVSGSTGGGFEAGGQVQDLNGGTISAMQRAHMHWVKRQSYAGDGAAGLIGEAHGAGFKILLSVIGDRNAVVDGGYQDGYAAFVGGLAASGADAIEVWNEMNIDREWRTGSINPAIYVSLLAKAYNAIKQANPKTLVITGALAPTGAEGAFGTDRVWNDDRYYAGMASAGAGRYSDCIGVHYNEGIVSPTQRSGDPRGNYPTRYFSTMLSRALSPFGGKKGCFTELGYLTPEGYGPLPGGFAWAQNTTVAQQAAWLAQAAVMASGSGRVRLMIVFNVDFTRYDADPQAGYAMIRPGGACPACVSLERVVR